MSFLTFFVSKNLASPRFWQSLSCMVLLCQCNSTEIKPQAQTLALETIAPVTVNQAERMLLEMPFEEAKAISPQNVKVGTLFQVAADSIEVLKKDKDGNPTKIKAKGHVFVDMALQERATAMCEEATLSATDATLSGRPMIKRGNRVVKSTELATSFWVSPAKLRVVGRCEMATLEELPPPVMLASADFFPVPEPMLPITQPWTASATNVLLPALPEVGR
jgi:predicted pyridoxine 5'-phosphate oxidase superfamily flavin-nucleotide-binding protein